MEMVIEAYLQTHSNLLKYYSKKENCPEGNCEETVKYFMDNQDKIKFDMFVFGLYQPNFEIIETLQPNYEDDVNSKLKDFLDHTYPVLKVSLKVDTSKYRNEQELKEFKEILSDEAADGLTIEDLNMTKVAIVFEKRINDLVVAANLSNPGSFRITKGAYVQNGKYVVGIDKLQSSFFKYTLDFCNKIGYPSFEKIEFIKVWNWLNQFKNYNVGFSDSKVERALNCFTFLFEKSEPERLFYSIMGIEALYAVGNGGLQEQVKSKSEVFLGKQEGFKKVYSSMYDFRSRFIHGDLNFPTKHSYSMDDRNSKFNKSMHESTYFSTGLLVASLQKLCLLNKLDIDFEIRVCD
jgi:hypothetical protein